MSATILIVEDEANARKHLSDYLEAKGYATISATTLQEARKHIEAENADIVLLDVQLPDGYGTELLAETAGLQPRPPIILITAYGDIDMAVEAMKNGAHDFLQKPIQLERLTQSIQRAREIVAMRRELAALRAQQRRELNFVVGKTPQMKQLVRAAQRAAELSVPVLITGETGTGKEVLAKAIHQLGPRKNKPMIAINCAAIQPTMLEAELFGFEAGSFTNATKRKIGLMEAADEGVLFLDEIASMPLDMQAKLLRALEEKAIRRVGGNNTIKVDVHIIAASNRDLQEMITKGEFRQDLYYRLKVLDLHLPPLRERKVDIPQLASLFLEQLNREKGMNIQEIAPEALEVLMAYDWPGNIRELRNTIERAMLFCDGERLQATHLMLDAVPH
ncbi:MAG: sigma-54-dependent Fis family transcriptional regulator [Anaerolineae bacterium]|nr:MAG: sigma-54-dependent Fis family transcriptional regulator [Anaerolineae bacterium]